jgi:hypothetical protein
MFSLPDPISKSELSKTFYNKPLVMELAWPVNNTIKGVFK